ncbi:MAG: ATP-binding protein [Pseudomonadota bacterium]|nr:ATP-binding protein [Pseudomonadota bacterium]
MLCGKIAAGKSTLAARLAEAESTVLLSEDHLLARLYPGEINTIDDYVRCATRLREAIGSHIVTLLRQGVSIVLDFQANTLAARGWMRGLFEQAGARHQLHYLRTSDKTCRMRLQARNAAGTHDYQVSEAEFDLFTRFFVVPGPEEGFHVIQHR